MSRPDEEIEKIARAVVREQEMEALRTARRECISEDQVAERMRIWREKK